MQYTTPAAIARSPVSASICPLSAAGNLLRVLLNTFIYFINRFNEGILSLVKSPDIVPVYFYAIVFFTKPEQPLLVFLVTALIIEPLNIMNNSFLSNLQTLHTL